MKRFVPYPFLLLTAIIINRVIISFMHISPVESVRSLLFSACLLGAAMIIVQRFVRDWDRTNFLAAMFMVAVLLYQVFYRWFKFRSMENSNLFGLILIPCFAYLYFIVTSRRWWKLIPNPTRITYYSNIVFVFLLGLQLAQLGVDALPMMYSRPGVQITAIPPLAKDIHLDPGTRPDIYVIVLDGYGRQDVLEKIYGYDNSEFLDQLRERGFYVADDSHSNYIQTTYTIASMMNFDYVQPWRSSSDYAQYILEPIQDNRVFQLLNRIGYTTVSFDGTTSYTQLINSDIFYSSFLPLNKFETFLLTDTPLEPLTNVFRLGFSIPNYDTHRFRVLNKLDAIQSVPTTVHGPKITYFHILVPHPPFVFDENGDPIQPNRPYSIMDGDEYSGSLDEYRAGYRGQVVFVNKKILEAVDTILARSATPPVIVLMGDHGPGSMFKWSLDDPGCLWERTHNLYAVLLPGHQNDGTAYPGMTPVNTFRVIFNTYFGSDLPLLDDRTYLMAWQYPNVMVDITNKRDSINGCTLPDD